MTKAQLKYVKMLLYKNEYLESEYSEVALDFSGGHTSELSELDHTQTQRLILSFTEAKDETGVNKILSLAHDLGWEHPNGKINMELLNSWLLKHTSFKKELNELVPTEIEQVVGVMFKMKKTGLKTS